MSFSYTNAGSGKPENWTNEEISKWFKSEDWKFGWAVAPDESIDPREFCVQFFKNQERWEKAFRFLKDSDFKTLPVGKYKLEGDSLIVNVDEYTTRNEEDSRYEAHRKYADIQYVVSGEEQIGVVSIGNTNEITPYNCEKDIAFLSSEQDNYRFASPEKFFVFFPEDAHRPCVKIVENKNVRKVVVKVQIMNEFDSKAASWDQDPKHWERSQAIVSEMISSIPLDKTMTALEFGAGTGIASFLLKDSVKEIVLMDNSPEMVRVIKEKIKAADASNLTALNFDLVNDDYSAGKFDLIFSQMVLHHVEDTGMIIGKLCHLLNPGGYLVIADLYAEDGAFHGDGFTGHRGFEMGILSEIIRKQGLKKISHRQCYVINKKVSDTETRQFPVFLLIAN